MSLLSTDTLRLVLDTMTEGVVLHDAAGRIVWFNPSAARILGADQLAALASAEPAWNAVGDDGAVLPVGDHPAMVALKTGKAQRDVVIGLANGGRTTWLSVNAEPVMEGDRPTAVVTSFVDITANREGSLRLRSLETQLRHGQKMEAMGHLTGGIAHDFNNLLTAILTNADLLDEQMTDVGPEAREELDDLRRAARRGADLVRKLMVFARRERGELQRVEIADLLYDSARLLRRVVPESIQLQTQVARDLAAIDGDPAALEQLLMNLATNARDAMPGGGVLRIQAEPARLDTAECDAMGWGRPGEIVLITVSDTGSGMDAAVLERVYDPFFTTKPVGAGTGLGMSIVYGVMQQHGGNIRIESSPGKGTRIELRFLAAPTSTRQRADDEAADVPRGTETVLLVEDNEAVRAAARRILERSGYKVVVATNGADGLQLFQHQRDVALVLADIVMPVMGGIELVEAIQRSGRTPKVLLTSGYTERTRDAERLGVAMLPKPWTPAQLARKVREVLDAKVQETR